MNVSILLIIYLLAFTTYLAGDKLFKVALFFSLSSLGCAILLLNQFNAGENISVIHQWINQPNISCTTSRWFSNRDDPINTSINPIIIFSSFENEYKMQKRFML
jgi:NADH-quinone oxidoreductase subunit M